MLMLYFGLHANKPIGVEDKVMEGHEKERKISTPIPPKKKSGHSQDNYIHQLSTHSAVLR